MKDRDVCYMHGGKTPRGAMLPQTKHGKFSKDLPTHLLADYEDERSDPELLNLSDSIAVIRARYRELFRQMETGSLWGDLEAAWGDMEAAQRAKNGKAVVALVSEIGQIIRRGAADSDKWREITGLMEQERKLIETEQKRRVAMQTMLTAEQGRLVIQALLDSVNRHVSDKRITAAIGADIVSLFGDGTR